MAYSVKVLADSISEAGVRLVTFLVILPRIMLAELNTHRMFSRNSASSRAIPVGNQLVSAMDDPFIPIYWGANQPGMQAEAEIDEQKQQQARAIWLKARANAMAQAEELAELGLHKQIVNRILEPFMWHAVIVTATEWSNFYALRDNPKAQPEIQRAASMMRAAMDASKPQLLRVGEWHLPLIGLSAARSEYDEGPEGDEQYQQAQLAAHQELAWAKQHPEDAVKVSAARCARISYLTHEGVRDISKDLELYGRLVRDGHMSSLEHPATPYFEEAADGSLVNLWSGNFRGWKQHRKMIPNEDDFSKRL